MEITAQLVKQLRARSGVGMMECKKALTQNNGDIEVAIEWLRKQGLAKADKKADRVAAEGRIVLAQSDENRDGGKAVLVEINCETDFVGKDESFLAFANDVAKVALASGAPDVQELLDMAWPGGGSVDLARQALVATIGENIQVRRMVRVDSANTVGAYVHGGRIGVLVELKGASAEFARNVAMHVAAMNPSYVSAAHVPAEIVAKEREIALAQISEKDKAKPAEILEKITSGKVNKVISEMTLTGQPFVLDTNMTVKAALKKEGAQVLTMYRLAVGEGIEKKEEDFHAEVMKQAGLA
jgi:elongation factor Ts